MHAKHLWAHVVQLEIVLEGAKTYAKKMGKGSAISVSVFVFMGARRFIKKKYHP